MKVLPDTIARLFSSKDSKLHLVYFVDHTKTRTMTLSRIPVIMALVTISCSGVGVVFGSLYLNSQIKENHRLTRNAERAKGELLSYQLRYDNVWERAYPHLVDAPQDGTSLASEPVQTPKAPTLATSTENVAKAKASEVVISDNMTAPPDSPKKDIEKLTDQSQKTPEAVTSGKELKKPTKIEVSAVIVKEMPNAFFIDFDLYNLDKKEKAKGLFWARIVLENANHKKPLVSHHEAENIVAGQTPDNQIPTFSVRKYRRCHLQIEKPTESYGRPVSAEIIISDRRGSIIHRQVVDLKKNIAIKNQGKNKTIQ